MSVLCIPNMETFVYWLQKKTWQWQNWPSLKRQFTNTPWTHKTFLSLCFPSCVQCSMCRYEMIRQLMNMHDLDLSLLYACWNTKLIPNIHQSIWLRLKGLPACLPPRTHPHPPHTHLQPPCFRHVLVIIKHNNGFYKSPSASLLLWIIQPKSERWRRGREEERRSIQVGPRTWRWQATDEAFGSELLMLFPSTFFFFFLHLPHCFCFFFTHHFRFPPDHGPHTHTWSRIPARYISSAVNYGCTSC